MEIINKPIDLLIPYAKNARVHDDAQIAQLAGSIKEFGFNNPILIDKDNGIIAGHGRVMAARKLGLKEVPTILLDHLNETQRKAYILADNRIAINSSWDNEMLSLELMDIKDDVSLAMLGFSVDELDALLNPTQLTDGLTDEDAVPDVPEEPKTKLGDIYQLGNHRLMCGDSTSIDAVEKLVNNAKIDLCYTDPPYGINEKGDRSKRTGAAEGTKYIDFQDDTIDYAVEAYQIVEGVLQVPRQVWWGANYYCHALPQSNNWFVWDKRVEEKQKDTQSDCELAWIKSKWSSVRIFRHLWKGMMKDSERGQHRVHPTQKPVALAEWSFDYFKEVNTVLDLFGGSGSTLMACEKTNRLCYMMEFEPHYCDVIIKRWEDFTGKKAVLL
jgi:DNA modification methylase